MSGTVSSAARGCRASQRLPYRLLALLSGIAGSLSTTLWLTR
ncbi:hypothetical protein [Streptomyces sp. MMG1533]|nr:hypothetical protein [Streptomyces sp. MMG1533]